MFGLNLKLWAYAIGGALLATLGVTSVYFKNKAKRLKQDKDTLKATIHAERTKKKIEKEKKKELSRRESDIKEKKDVKDPSDLDDLFNDSDW